MQLLHLSFVFILHGFIIWKKQIANFLFIIIYDEL